MKNTICFFLFVFYFQASIAQQTNPQNDSTFLKQDSLFVVDREAGDTSTSAPTPYHTSLLNDGLIIAAAAGVNFVGNELIKNKKDLTMDQLAGKTRDKLPFFDRGNAGYYSKQADRDSYVLFTGSFAIPVAAALLNKNERAKFGQIMAMYFETMAITGSMYTITAGLVYRSRPFVYGNKAPLEKRLDKGAQRSFYGGHVATTAAATFFTAKVFSDFNPGSKLTPWLYGAAGGSTIVMGYFRYRSGYHFLSDCMLSAAMGIATGILVPQFHKNKSLKNISLTPAFENNSKGFLLTYKF